MTDSEAAALALQFMERAQLTGAEVPAYAQAQAWLQGVVAAASGPAPEFKHVQTTKPLPMRSVRMAK